MSQREATERERRRRGRPSGPETPWLPQPFTMTWRDGAFFHWPVDPDRLRPHVPAPLDLETRDGRAWLSVVPFVLARTGLRGTPPAARLTFPEVNLRTYVTCGGLSGLYFFSIDLDGPLLATAARYATGVPCFHARQRVARVDDRIAFSSARREGDRPAAFEAVYRPRGAASRADHDSLSGWLVERRRTFVPRGGRVYVAEISHDPWPLKRADATIEANDLFAAAGLPTPPGDPRVSYCDRLEITGSVLRRFDPG